RDIKPSNVWLQSPGDTVRLLDFGLARSDKSSHAQSGLLVGTPRYVSPEQVRSEPVDARSDLYSVGVTMYEMLSGQLPHDEPSASLQLAAIVAKRPKSLSELCPKLPTELTTIVDRLLEKKAELRPESAGELLEVLEQFKPPKRRALVQRRKRNKWLQLITELRLWFLVGCLLIPGYLGYMLTSSWLFPAGVIGELAEAPSVPLELTQPLPPVASVESERRSYVAGEDGQSVFAVGKTEARRGDYVNMSYQPTYVRETPVFEFEIEEDWGAKQCIDATLSFTLKGGATSSGERTVMVYGIEMESEKLLSQKKLEELIRSQEATELGVWQFNNRGYRKNGVVDGLRFSSKKLIDFIRNRKGCKLVFWLWRKDQSNGQTHFYSDVIQPDRLPKLWVELAGAKVDTTSELP
ncbi:MAG: serine/threonine-protein kinase, partial [Planctomycetota bacterium]